MSDLSEEIRRAATEPRSVSVDGTNVQAVPVGETIKADRYLKDQSAGAKNHLGLHFRKLIPGD